MLHEGVIYRHIVPDRAGDPQEHVLSAGPSGVESIHAWWVRLLDDVFSRVSGCALQAAISS